METAFPFGLPEPTAFYLTLYVLTFALHHFFMHYVLAGAIVVAATSLFPGRGELPRASQPMAASLRDWMPFMLSAAITVGVAPLLFIQIVYPLHFYSANLLLGWRWMVVIPVLIVAFYLLYVLKVSYARRWAYGVNSTAAVATAGCFVFVGFCWTANHLISNAPGSWPGVYVSGVSLSPLAVALRMLVWIGGAFASLAVIAGWQMAFHKDVSEDAEKKHSIARTLAIMAAAGLTLAALAGVGYLVHGGERLTNSVTGYVALPYLIVSIVGAVGQVVAWWFLQRKPTALRPLLLVAATVACAITLVSVSVVRESIRLHSIDIAQLESMHQQAADIGGFSVFLLFSAVNGGLIAWAVWMVRQQLKSNHSNPKRK